MNAIQTEVETRIAAAAPSAELLLAEVATGGALRVFIDHPDGVTLDLCERVSKALAPLSREYAIEVSSPGRERPLTKPEHFRRFVGQRARIRTRVARDGHKSFTGELVGATDREVTVAAPTGILSIPYAEIKNSNLVGD